MINPIYQVPENPYCVLMGNAEFPRKDLCDKILAKAEFIICTDGGANYAYDHQITPHLIIGDLDSIRKDSHKFFSANGVMIRSVDSQQENDLEKGFNYIFQETVYRNILLLGFLGDRDDQSFATLQIAQKFSRIMTIQIYSINSEYILLPPGSYSIGFKKNYSVSLFGLPVAYNVRTQGLKWNLDQEDLSEGSRGVSNSTTTDTVELSFDKGQLILITPLRSL